MECFACNGIMKAVKSQIRPHVGCPAKCGGKLVEKVVGQQCSTCGVFVST